MKDSYIAQTIILAEQAGICVSKIDLIKLDLPQLIMAKSAVESMIACDLMITNTKNDHSLAIVDDTTVENRLRMFHSEQEGFEQCFKQIVQPVFSFA